MARLLDSILVIDVESTCWDGPPPEGQTSEIIEIGLCRVEIGSLDRVEKQSLLVKPEISEISEFCTKLTTLTPEMLWCAGSIADAVSLLRKRYQSQDRLWASWGDYDRRQFERVCHQFHISYPFGSSHLNVKTLFAAAYGLNRELGLDEAYQYLGLEMQGVHHRGGDDAWNIAGILCLLLKRMRGNSA